MGQGLVQGMAKEPDKEGMEGEAGRKHRDGVSIRCIDSVLGAFAGLKTKMACCYIQRAHGILRGVGRKATSFPVFDIPTAHNRS